MLGKIKNQLRNIVKNSVIMLYHIMYKTCKVKNNTIIFSSNMGRNYTGNPKYIYEEMVSRGLDEKLNLIWIFDDVSTKIPGKACKVKNKSIPYLYYMAVAKVWVFDSRQPKFIMKKDSVTYIQTWHGTPLKKLALDLDDVSMSGESSLAEYKANFKANTSTWDYLLSQNSYSTQIFRQCFAFDKEMLEVGYPRNDILINSNTNKDIARLKNELGLPMDKKVILYAPTWRDNEFYRNGEYKFVQQLDFDMAFEELNKEYVFIVKYHYLVKEHIDWKKYKGFVYDFNSECDIAKLYLVSDILITDYSSVMFDYSLLKRPMLFFAYDLENYRDELRGFYFDFMEEAPGAISQTTKELMRDISECMTSSYKEQYKAKEEQFYNKYNHLDDGKASEHIVDLIMKLI